MAGTFTSRLRLYKPAADGSDDVNVVTDLNNNLDRLDAIVSFVPVTLATYPASGYHGQAFYETDTGKAYVNISTSASTITKRQLLLEGGSFGASATFTGGLFSGGEIRSTQSTGAGRAFVARLTGDSWDRWRVDQDGAMSWGGAAGETDVAVERSGVGALTLNGSLTVTGSQVVSGSITSGDISADDVSVGGRLVIGSSVYRPFGGGTQIVSNTTTETVVATYTIPAGDVTPGAVFRLKVTGLASVTGTPNFTMRMRIGGVGGTQVVSSGTFAASSGVQNKPIEYEGLFTILATGVSGGARGWSKLTESLSVSGNGSPTTTSTIRQDISTSDVVVDTTISRDLVVTVQWGTASASNSYLAINKVLERVA